MRLHRLQRVYMVSHFGNHLGFQETNKIHQSGDGTDGSNEIFQIFEPNFKFGQQEANETFLQAILVCKRISSIWIWEGTWSKPKRAGTKRSWTTWAWSEWSWTTRS
uniref:Uncharacterized protein n=1 Tax=Cacopsylla melanoneura TaxID=428564 RepID=A0A8D8W992_9HEMI